MTESFFSIIQRIHRQSFINLALLFILCVGAVISLGFPTASQEISSITWTTVASQQYRHSEAQSVVVNGLIYSFGGFDSRKPCCTPTRRAYVYTPSTNKWTALADMPKGVTHAGMTTDGTNIYYAGGYIENAAQTGQIFGTREVWRYNVADNNYTALPLLPVDRAAGQLQYLDGKLHYFGGTNKPRTQDVGDHYVLDLNGGVSWTTVTSSLPNPRHHSASVVINHQIYAIGGQHGHDGQLIAQDDVHRYDPVTDSWTELASLPTGLNHIQSTTVVLDGKIIVMGGQVTHGSMVDTVYSYDPDTDTWTLIDHMPFSRHSGVGGVIDGNLYFGGGNVSSTYKGVPNYPATETPTETATETATVTETDTPTETQTLTATPTETVTATDTPTETVTATPTDDVSSTPSETATATESPTDDVSSTPTETASATDSTPETPTATDTPTETVTATPTDDVSSTPSETATDDEGEPTEATITATEPSGTPDPTETTLTATATEPSGTPTEPTTTATEPTVIATEPTVVVIEPTPTDDDPIIIPGGMAVIFQEGDVSPQFFWTEYQTLPAPEWYHIVIADENDVIIFDDWFEAAVICNGTYCSIVLDGSLLSIPLTNGGYSWWIQAWGSNQFTEWSAEQNFSLEAPQPLAPGDFIVNINQGRPSITLNNDPGTTYIQVYIGTPDFQQVHLKWYEKSSAVCDVTICNLDLDAHLSNGGYVAYIQTWGPAGFNNNDANYWAGGKSFEINFPAPVTPVNLSANFNNGQPTFTWDGASGATWYQIWIGTETFEMLYMGWHSALDLGCGNLGTCTLTSEVNSDGASLKWYVQAWGPGGFSNDGLMEGWSEGPALP